jgi:hypothetical protein
LISYVGHHDAGRVLWNAVMDDSAPLPKGQVVEYWRGCTDMDPNGKRAGVFRIAHGLYDLGRVELVQARMGDDDFSYRAVVK